MPQRTNPFQQLVHLIEHQLAPREATVTESKMFTDQVTGQPREVDIVIETRVGIHPFVIGVECKDSKRPADAPWIEGISSKHQHIGIHKTIAVSKAGFYKPALKKAEQLKIEPLSLKQAETSDWVTYTSRLLALESQGVETIVPPVCTEIRVEVVPPLSPPYPPVQLDKEEDCILYDATDKPIGSIKQVVDLTLDDPTVRAHIEQEALPNTTSTFALELGYFNGSFVIDTAKAKHEVAQIVIKGEVRKDVSSVTLNKANYGRAGYGIASVLHGDGEHMGVPVRVTWTEQEDGRMIFGASFGEPGSGS